MAAATTTLGHYFTQVTLSVSREELDGRLDMIQLSPPLRRHYTTHCLCLWPCQNPLHRRISDLLVGKLAQIFTQSYNLCRREI